MKRLLLVLVCMGTAGAAPNLTSDMFAPPAGKTNPMPVTAMSKAYLARPESERVAALSAKAPVNAPAHRAADFATPAKPGKPLVSPFKR